MADCMVTDVGEKELKNEFGIGDDLKSSGTGDRSREIWKGLTVWVG